MAKSKLLRMDNIGIVVESLDDAIGQRPLAEYDALSTDETPFRWTNGSQHFSV